MKKKSKGVLDDFLPTLIFLALMAILLFLFIGYNKAINQKTTLNNIARKYLLEMETTGYMTTEMQNSLKEELSAAGFAGNESGAEISRNNFYGTTFTDVGYGNEMIINIQAYTKNMVIATSSGEDATSDNWNMLEPHLKDEYKPIKITYKSTSKE